MESKSPKVSVKVSFIMPDGCTDPTECSRDMIRAFEMCTLNSMDVRWINKQDVNPKELQKNDVIVFQSFEGETFDKVKNTKSVRIVGPNCLHNCLLVGRPIPNGTWPVFNMAMANCYITCSNLSKPIKENIKQKIQEMGGTYTTSIYESCTHLITNSVKSEKYLIAAENKIKIMLPDWVDAVWISSQSYDIGCNDEAFTQYQCLPLQNLTICTTGFHVLAERNKLQELIKTNGACYTGQMNLNKTDILICKDNCASQKLKAASKTKNVKCLTLNWLMDSIEKGYALPDTGYLVKRGTSTPTKNDEFINPNFSTVSAIDSTHSGVEQNTLQETIITTNILKPIDNKKRKSDSMDDENDIIYKIDLKRVKKAGSFLDGCSIYLAGFGSEQREKLYKILNFSGATRYEELSDRLTHIIVGDTKCQELKLIQSKGYQVPVVNVQWLGDCVEQEKMIPEENYLIKSSPSKECGSPLSKKGLQLLRNIPSASEADDDLQQENIPAAESCCNSEIMMQYLKPNLTNQSDTSTFAQLLKDGKFFNTNNETNQSPKQKQQPDIPPNTTSDTTACTITTTQEDTTDWNPIFQGLKLLLVNFDEEAHAELKDSIEAFGGEVVPNSYKGVPDYAIVPAFNSETAHTANEIVTDYWLTECWKDNELKEIAYYHRPFTVRNGNVLKGCVVTISSYTGTERLFLIDLIKELGGMSQEQLSRVEKNGILASTHLLSAAPSGAKYEAALKWGRPVVNKDWLFECAKLGKIVSEKDYLLKNIKAPEPVEDNEETTVSCQESHHRTISESHNSQEETLKASKLNDSKATPRKATTDKNYEVPTSSKRLREQNLADFTPPSNAPADSSITCSQITPVNKIMSDFRSNYMLGTPPATPPLPKRWGDVDTPDTPYGAFIRPNPSPHLRKEMLKWINKFPEKKRRDSTPLSELKRRLWDKICPPRNTEKPPAEPLFGELGGDKPVPDQPDDFEELSGDDEVFQGPRATTDDCPPRKLNFENLSEDENECEVAKADGSVPAKTVNEQYTPETPENIQIRTNFQQLKEMLSSTGSTRKVIKKRESTVAVEEELKNSQAYTVGWEYGESDTGSHRVPHFMLSGVGMEEREEMVAQLQSLGATVSELNNYDPASTHLITNRPSRNEKMLSSMAAGKWILHSDYLKKSLEAGKLLKEDEFEYGNPNFSKDIDIQFDKDAEIRARAIHLWRKEITKRGYGAFHDIRAIIVSNKKESIVRVIEAGGGMVIDANPPFSDEIYATHCLLDPKFVPNMIDYIPLAQQGIYIFNTVYINEFLHRAAKDAKDCILPIFSKYYD